MLLSSAYVRWAKGLFIQGKTINFLVSMRMCCVDKVHCPGLRKGVVVMP